MKVLSALCVSFLVLLGVQPALAAPVRVDIYGAGQQKINLAQASPLSAPGVRADAAGAELQGLITENLHILPFVQLVDSAAVLGGAVLPGADMPNIDLKRFQLAGAAVLITANWPGGDAPGRPVEMRVFDTNSGQRLFAAQYPDTRKELLPEVADRFCANLLEVLIGNGDFFRSTLAFVKKGGRHKADVWVMKPTGRGLRQITNMPGETLSPTWSLDGRFIVFSHIDDRSHALGVWDRNSGQVQRIRFPGNTVIGPAFTPENKVAVALSQGKNPNIYQLNHAFQVERPLEVNNSINVSPSFDAGGTKMAFTSSRLGGPQIFMKDLSSGSVTRVSREGGYNTEPNLSRDGVLIVYTRLTEMGQRIFVQDLRTGMERQLTFGPGSDEQPSFAADSYFIAFTSSRGGARQIYLTTRHGGEPTHLRTGGGDVSFPRWGLIK
ncbi:MAG: translocation protein TolB [Deltaproteobacteria bacterium]|jgi:TolB protein|nr:translocation protein TolB [Deltaproteobacteria bacterium]